MTGGAGEVKPCAESQSKLVMDRRPRRSVRPVPSVGAPTLAGKRPVELPRYGSVKKTSNLPARSETQESPFPFGCQAGEKS